MNLDETQLFPIFVYSMFALFDSFIIYRVSEVVVILLLLKTRGHSHEALIKLLRTEFGGRGARFWVHFDFKPHSTSSVVETKQVVSHKRFAQLAEGQTVQIRYLPSNFQIARLWGGDADNHLFRFRNIFIVFIVLMTMPTVLLLPVIFAMLLYHFWKLTRS